MVRTKEFNIVATPDQQHEPCFARDEQKASLGVLLTVLKCEIRPSTILTKEGKLYLLLAYLYH